MIPIQPRPEPSNFNINVRSPGTNFLARVPHPVNKQWHNNHYWTRCIPDLYKEYRGICAYIGTWIPRGSATVDHYVPKSIDPQQAYEWRNYRLSCKEANSNKKDSSNILDPFRIQYDWFLLDFSSLLVTPNQNISINDFNRVELTINTLRLNEEYFIEARQHWLMEYIRDSDFDFLEMYAPFVAYELNRQNLKNKIIQMMQVSPP